MERTQKQAEQAAGKAAQEILKRIRKIHKTITSFDRIHRLEAEEILENKDPITQIIRKHLIDCYTESWITEAEALEVLYGARLHVSFLSRLAWIKKAHEADMELIQAARRYVAKTQAPDAPLPTLWLADGVVSPKATRDALDYLTTRHFLKYIQQCDDIKRGPVPKKDQTQLEAWRSGLKGESGLGYGLTSLLRTESDTAQATASFDVYSAAGIGAYRYNAMLDDKTCDKCRDLHGKIFLLSEKQPGVNFPLIHPNCRCFIEPVIIE